MKSSNEQVLLKKFPLLYRNAELIKQQRQLTNRVFEVEDGWFLIVYDLSSQLEEYLLTLQSSHSEKNIDLPYAPVIKEKFGELVLNLSGIPPDDMDKIFFLMEKAAAISVQICELCGLEGKTYWNLPWIRTLCPQHYTEKVREYSQQGVEVGEPVHRCRPIDSLKEFTKKSS